jgi:hypothetical protein
MLGFGLARGSAATGKSQSTTPLSAASPSPPPSELGINDEMMQRMSRQIAGREREPASKVFKNIQLDIFKNVPAGRFLLIMNRGYSRALGVRCSHCHDGADFASDDKRQKRAAREMAIMHFAINQQLTKMENLAGNPEGHAVSCAICHRGTVKPTDP